MTHVVLYRFTDAKDAHEAVRRLQSMAGQIESLHSIRAGTDGRGEPNAYDVVLITEHDDLGGLETYLVDPFHLEIAAWIRPRVAERAVVDTLNLG